jgi:RNA polymerase-binding transcription factor DksA
MTTSGLEPELVRELAARLEREQGRRRQSLRSLHEAEVQLSESQAGESDAGGAPADVASDLFEQEIDISLEQSTAARLEPVEAALERLANGGYGRCRRCQQPIAVERLQAVPWAAYCRNHAEPPRR